MGRTLSKPKQRWLSGGRLPSTESAPPSGDRRAVGAGLPGIPSERDVGATVTISVICPTRNRSHYHERLYRQFSQQDHPNKELLVLDDSSAASTFFTRIMKTDLGVRYEHSMPMSIGAARNALLAKASGTVIAHFDDDDEYMPSYLSSMLERLRALDADFVKLSTWRQRDHKSGRIQHHDARTRGEADLWGWGFSYMYRRSVASRVSFPAISHGEDYLFVQKVRALGLKAALIHDGPDWVQKRYADHVRHV